MSLTIFNKIQDFIRAKVKPDPDPALVSAADVAEILENLNTEIEGVATIPDATATTHGLQSATHYRKAKALPTLNSPDIEILTAPTLYKSGSLLAATSGSVRYLGTTYAIPAVANIGSGIAALDGKQFFTILSYDSGSDAFSTSVGYAVTIGGAMVEKLFLNNQTYAGLYQYSGGVLSEVPFNYVTSVVLSDGTRLVANAKGEVPMPVPDTFTPIAEDEFGTHPAFATQHEVNAYLLSGGTYTPPAPATFGSATATPVSSSSDIDITWTI